MAWRQKTAMPSGAEVVDSAALDTVKLEAVSVPVVRDGAVQGYVIARIAFTAPSSEVKSSKSLLTAMVSEAALRSIFEDATFDFSNIRPLDVTKLADAITSKANARMGNNSVRAAVIESLNFIPQSQNRGQQRMVKQ